MKITFIGLGIMGSRMASHLLENGLDLTVYNRSAPPQEALAAKGAKTATSAVEAVAEADLVISMLSTPEVVEALFFGEDGLLSAMPKGAIWADCSTVNPSFSLRAAQAATAAGIQFVDAPVAGSKPQAAAAQLAFFVGGSQALFQRVEPIFQQMGAKVLHVGETGKGASFKMLVNAMLAQSMILFSESVLLGEKLGLSKDFLLDTLPKLPVVAPFTQFKTAMIKDNDYEVQFPLELMYKDLHLAAMTAYEHDQPLHLANAAKELYAAAKHRGMGRLDFAAIHRYLERG
ncbi:MAG: NAD(P)-dependent oxidoreductase [Bacteroidota bacterium]